MNQGIAQEIVQVMPTAYGLGVFVSSASFVSPVQIQGATGNSVGGYNPIAGLQNIPCMNAPESGMKVSSDETRLLPHIEAERHRHVLLKGYYQQLDTGFSQGAGMGWEVTITDAAGNSQDYDFLGGEGDSQVQMTRIKVMLVTV